MSSPEATPTASPTPSDSLPSSPTPTAAAGDLTAAQLKLRLIDQLGPLWYCDPDEYPVAYEDEQQRAIERFDEVRADAEAFDAIVERLGLAGRSSFSDPEKLAIYRSWKQLNAIRLDPVGTARYAFDYLAQPPPGGGNGTRTIGTIDRRGLIEVQQQGPAGEPNCPICLTRGTLIATPAGPVPVEQLRAGDPVWTVDASGHRARGVVIGLGSAPAPASHRVVRLVLDDGRELRASPGHPLADGRLLGELRIGDRIGSARVVAADLERYGEDATFDLLASGATGAYWANGVLLASTLRAD